MLRRCTLLAFINRATHSHEPDGSTNTCTLQGMFKSIGVTVLRSFLHYPPESTLMSLNIGR
jgi:hypothetical protein